MDGKECGNKNFVARLPAGSSHPVTLSKNGVRHVRQLQDGETKEFLSVGLACSECFSGANLHKILKPGFEFEMKIMQELMNGDPAAPLSIHTSSGVPTALAGFVDSLKKHLPWKLDYSNDHLDWCVSLQLEGASAVWAAIDLLLQVLFLETGEKCRTKVAVGSVSYHGPPATSFGASSPLWNKANQLMYPVPIAGTEVDEIDLLSQYKEFLRVHGHEIGVILFEPQWGSSQAGMPWSPLLLKEYIRLAKEQGIKVICDEIMCGLGRHGKGTLFLSEAWDLDPDAITFGKAIGGGVFPLSGAILKRGRALLELNQCTVMQSHTYAGSSTRALMTATEVLNELPLWLPSIAKLGEEMEHIFRFITKLSQGLVICHGQGLMWGGVFTRNGQCQDKAFRQNVIAVFQKHCEDLLFLPYHVPVGGFMVSPVIDIDVGTIYEIGERFETAIIRTMKEVGWMKESLAVKSIPCDTTNDQDEFDVTELAARISSNDKCLPQLHATRSCTSCSKFVCKTVRTRFINV